MKYSVIFFDHLPDPVTTVCRIAGDRGVILQGRRYNDLDGKTVRGGRLLWNSREFL